MAVIITAARRSKTSRAGIQFTGRRRAGLKIARAIWQPTITLAIEHRIGRINHGVDDFVGWRQQENLVPVRPTDAPPGLITGCGTSGLEAIPLRTGIWIFHVGHNEQVFTRHEFLPLDEAHGFRKFGRSVRILIGQTHGGQIRDRVAHVDDFDPILRRRLQLVDDEFRRSSGTALARRTRCGR